MTDTAKGTVLSLLVKVGRLASTYQDHVLRNLPCERIEADEIWAFVGATTDGHAMYVDAVRSAFGWRNVDYAQLVKSYGQQGTIEEQRRYSPPVCTGTRKMRRIGNPDPSLVSTSMVERSNLQLRMTSRRFTRTLTKARGESRPPRLWRRASRTARGRWKTCWRLWILTARGREPFMEGALTDRWTQARFCRDSFLPTPSAPTFVRTRKRRRGWPRCREPANTHLAPAPALLGKFRLRPPSSR